MQLSHLNNKCAAQRATSIQIIRGKDIATYIDALGKFRIEIFREYPYLYEGDLEYERKYLGRYANSENSVLAMMFDERGLLASCTGIPLADEDQAFKAPFSGRNLSEMFYIGEVMVRAGSRGKGLGSKLLSGVISLIDPQQYSKICLCAVERGQNHPSRPEGYSPPDALWRKYGFEKQQGMVVDFQWKDVGDEMETMKPMHVWLREAK